MSDIRDTLNAEAAALERELQRLPLFVKLQKVRELLDLYNGTPASELGAVRSMPPPPPLGRNERILPRTRRANPDRERALAEAADYIKNRSVPTKTSEILEYLELIDVPVAGTVPLSNLSAMLHHSPMFDSHGRKGWTLAGERNVDHSDGNVTDIDDNVVEDLLSEEPADRDDFEEMLGTH